MVVDLIIAITINLVMILLLKSPVFVLWNFVFLPIIVVCWCFIAIGYVFVGAFYFIILIIIGSFAITTAIFIEPVKFILSFLVSIINRASFNI